MKELTGNAILVRLKWGQEYKGLLQAVDSYMNLLLDDTEEFQDGVSTGVLGEVLIRCNNVLFVKGLDVTGDSKRKRDSTDDAKEESADEDGQEPPLKK